MGRGPAINEAERLGQLAYCTYGRHREWTAVTGEAMQAWSQLPEDIRAAWTMAALAVRMAVEEG